MTHFSSAASQHPDISLSLHGPADLVAAVPFLLGFEPEHCIAAVFLSSDDGRVVVTMRVDEPPVDASADFCHFWRNQCEQVAAHNNVGRVVLVSYGSLESHVTIATTDSDVDSAQFSSLPIHSDSDTDESLSMQLLIAALANESEEVGLLVCDQLHVSRGRWRSWLCSDDECCPPNGNAIDEARRNRIAAEFVHEGIAVLSNRSEIAEQLSALPETDSKVIDFRKLLDDKQRELNELPAAGEVDLTTIRLKHLEGIVAALPAGDPGVVASAVVAFAETRLRDGLLHMLTQTLPGEDRRNVETHLSAATRMVSSTYCAPTATVVAGLAWQRGDGALAMAALKLALASDPTYSLARLLQRAIDRAVPPQVWVDAIANTTVQECLVGVAA